MDIKQFEKLSNSKITAGRKTRDVRNMLKQYKEEKQDAYEGVSELYKPLIDTQESVKKSIDDKQDQLINQLQNNQKAITSGLENVFIYNQLPETIEQDTTKLPIDYKPAMMPKFKSDMDKGFNYNDIQTLMKYNLIPPSDVLKSVQDKTIDFDEYNNDVGKITKKLGSDKGRLSKNKKQKEQNADQIDILTKEIKILQKYKNRINLIPEGLKTVGKGLYTQKKRNA